MIGSSSGNRESVNSANSEPVHFIDAHHHLWIPETRQPDLGYGWLRDIGAIKPFGDPTAIQRNYEWSEFASESAHKLKGSVYLQVDGAIADPVAETAWVQSVFEHTGLKHGIVGLIDLSSDSAQHVLEAQTRYSLFKGVRQILSRLDDNPGLCFASVHYLREARWRDQFQLLNDMGLSFDLQVYPEQMMESADFLARFPEVQVIVDHAGSPYDQSEKGMVLWREGLKVLAALSHVSVKLCGFGMFDVTHCSLSVRTIIDTVLELFEPERIMFGSNFPVDKLMGSYDDAFRLVYDNISQLSTAQAEAVWFRNAQRIYRL